MTLYRGCYSDYHNFDFILDEGVDYRVNQEYQTISRINDEIRVGNFMTLFTFTGKRAYVTDGDGNIKVDDNLISTGDKLVIETMLNPKISKEYHISVVGDVLKTGDINLDDAKKIATYVVDRSLYLVPNSVVALAADINDDGQIKMNDVVQLVKELGNGS